MAPSRRARECRSWRSVPRPECPGKSTSECLPAEKRQGRPKAAPERSSRKLRCGEYQPISLSFNFPGQRYLTAEFLFFPCDVGDFCRILKPLSSPRITPMGGNAWLLYRFPISSIDIWAE